MPRAQWHQVESQVEIILLEGWCVGAIPQSEAELIDPVNDLERLEDVDGTWRRHVNGALGGAYRQLFAKLDSLVLLAAPDFDVVPRWRNQQETELRSGLGSLSDLSRAMNKTELERFVLHYERLSRHILKEMPQRADLVLCLDKERNIVAPADRGTFAPIS